MNPQKLLGQNFIKNPQIINKMLFAADLTSQDTILEIGPGKGAITEKLAPKVKRVFAIEKDIKLVKYLKIKFKHQKNIKIIKGDILKFPNFLISQYHNVKYKIISNLPFYLTSRFLRVFLELKNKPILIVLIIQKEVAQRVCQQPPRASLLSNSVQFYAEPQIIDYVSKDNFFPKPEVDTAIIKIKILSQSKVKVKNINNFFRVMKIGFSQKRKQLHNNLSAGLHLNKENIIKVLKKANIDPTRRAQTLSLEEWEKITPKLLDLSYKI